MSLEGRCAVVTGGSRGIGRAICEELARQGANIVTCCRGDLATADETLAACRALGVQALAVQADVSTAEGVDALFDAAVKTFGVVDILVNNAGITRDNLILRMKEQDFDDVIETNLRGVFLCMKKASRLMLRRRQGRIITITSIVGLRGNAGQCNYAAAKAGVIGMTKSLAKELGSRGVTVNAVAPGFIETDMTRALPEAERAAYLASIPLNCLGEAQDVAAAVAFLAGDGARYITGQVLCVDGGLAM